MKTSFTTNVETKGLKVEEDMGIRQNSTLFLFFNMEESTACSYINRNDISNMEMLDDAREKKRIIIRAQTLERKKEI